LNEFGFWCQINFAGDVKVVSSVKKNRLMKP
jgi:hypothetical protein